MLLTDVAERSELTLGVVVHVPLWKNMVLLCATSPCDYKQSLDDSSEPSKYKLSDFLNKVGYCIRC